MGDDTADDLDDDEDDDDDAGPDEAEVRAALRALRAGDDATLGDVLTLAVAAADYETPLVPAEVVAAVAAKYMMDADLANGGMDQVAWNHGADAARSYASALRAVGALENADLLDRLAAAVDEHQAATDERDLVTRFQRYRAAVGGPFFPIPDPGDELAEPLLEFVLARASSLPDPDGVLARKPDPARQ